MGAGLILIHTHLNQSFPVRIHRKELLSSFPKTRKSKARAIRRPRGRVSLKHRLRQRTLAFGMAVLEIRNVKDGMVTS